MKYVSRFIRKNNLTFRKLFHYLLFERLVVCWCVRKRGNNPLNSIIKVIVFALLVFLPINLIAQPYEGEKGDVNNDGFINVLDMLGVANHILGIVNLDDQELWRADLNGSVGSCGGDWNVNILDMVKIANIILGYDECPGAMVIDIDGNVYRTVQIGTQVWMADNLKVTHYRNGDPISNVTDNSTWHNLIIGAYCNYDNDLNKASTFGRLYNWYAVSDTRNIAPEGWHVPNDSDWQTLVVYLGGMRIAGGKMKTPGTIEGGDGLWYYPNTGATNESGFTAIPSGYRIPNEHLIHYADYLFLGSYSFFWSYSEYDSINAWYQSLSFGSSYTSWYSQGKKHGFSVRCVKDN